jgi:hypothetical protein
MIGPGSFRTFALDCIAWAADADTSNRHIMLALATDSRDLARVLEGHAGDGGDLSDLRAKLN